MSLDRRATILSHPSWGGYSPLILDRGEQRGRRVAVTVTGIGGPDAKAEYSNGGADHDFYNLSPRLPALTVLVPIDTSTAITIGGREQV